MNDQFDREQIKQMLSEARSELTTKEKIEIICLMIVSATVSIALIVFAYSIAKTSNLF